MYRASRQPYTTPATVHTFQDAYLHLLNTYDAGDPIGRVKRLARQAVLEAWSEFPRLAEWNYYKRRGKLRTSAAVTSGTIAYTHSTRTVTLTGSTWPSDIADRRLEIASASYAVESVPSTTTLILPEHDNPGADIASGTSYAAVLAEIALPFSVRRMSHLMSLSNPVGYVSPHEFSAMRQTWCGNGTPLFYTLRGADTKLGGHSVEFLPAPSQSIEYDFLAQVEARPLRTWGADCEYTTGTVTNSGAEVTGVGTAFTSAMIGCAFRFTTSAANVPTGMNGDNPLSEYRIIKAVSSGTALTLDAAPDSTYSAKKFSIGDPLDVSDSMWVAFLRRCELNFARLVPIAAQVKLREEAWMQAYRAALTADTPVDWTDAGVAWIDLTDKNRILPAEE